MKSKMLYISCAVFAILITAAGVIKMQPGDRRSPIVSQNNGDSRVFVEKKGSVLYITGAEGLKDLAVFPNGVIVAHLTDSGDDWFMLSPNEREFIFNAIDSDNPIIRPEGLGVEFFTDVDINIIYTYFEAEDVYISSSMLVGQSEFGDAIMEASLLYSEITKNAVK